MGKEERLTSEISAQIEGEGALAERRGDEDAETMEKRADWQEEEVRAR